jgi:predicted nucleic acid-binding protein
MTVFLDTVGLLAVWDESDQWHSIAQENFSELSRVRADFITTTFILLECGNAAARRPYRGAVSRLLRQMEQGDRLITPTADDWRAAWIGYENSSANSAGIVDQFSFAAMKRLGVAKAFTNDQHFRAAGFETCF